MSQPDKSPEEARKRLETRLEAVEAEQARQASGDAHRAMAVGYRFLGEVVGGVLMGAGLGWLLDRFAGTAPLGLIFGLMAGTGLSIFVAVRSASKMTKDAMAKVGRQPSVPDHEAED